MRKLFVCFFKKSFVLELFFSEYNDKKRKKMLYKRLMYLDIILALPFFSFSQLHRESFIYYTLINN